MKKTLLFIFIVSLFITALFCISASANGSTTTVGNLTFTEYDTYCAVTKCKTSASGSITIPSSVNFSGTALPVTQIGNFAFSSCSKLTSVTIPDSVTSIGNYAFHYCSSLTSVTIPDSVTSIGDDAFYNCSGLTSVTIGNSVTSIGNSAFYVCSSLTNVTIGNSVTSIGDSTFGSCTGLKEVTILGSIVEIGEGAFDNCRSITSVYIKDVADWCGINFVDSRSNPLYEARNSCSLYLNNELITDLVIPDGVTSIGNNAFYLYKKFSSVTIPSSLTAIGYNAFSGCGKLDVYITDVGKWCSIKCNYFSSPLSNIASKLYLNGTLINDLVIPDGVTSIGEGAFYRCSNITSVTIPDSVTTIGFMSFCGCSSLKNVVIPDSVISVGEYAFSNCQSITTVVIPKGITKINSYTFDNCNSLKLIMYLGDIDQWISLPKGGSNNPIYTAVKVYGTKDVIIRDNIVYGIYDSYSVASGAFDVLSEEITIPEEIEYNGFVYPVTSIGYGAFINCSSIKSVVIPEHVTSICGNAFLNCNNLVYITIPESVSLIESSAFYDCNKLKWVIYSGNKTQWEKITTDIGNVPLYNAKKVYGTTEVIISDDIAYGIYDSYCKVVCAVDSLSGEVVIPGEIDYNGINYPVTIIGDNAFNSCSKLTSVTIPNSIMSIGYRAFAYCSGLYSVVISDSVTSIGDYAFFSCNALKLVIYTSNQSQWNQISVGNNNTPLTSARMIYSEKSKIINGIAYGIYDSYSVVIGAADKLVGNIIISDEIEYNKAIFPVISISNYAFQYCSGITSVTIPDSVISIGDYAFHVCSGLTSVTIPAYVTSIGDSAFSSCSKLSVIIIPNSVTSISNSTFSQCSNLVSVTIPNSVTSIGNYAFNYCTNLKSITLPDSVTSIGNSAFSQCSNLENLVIPNGITIIGEGAFAGCNNLININIPKNITMIRNYTFSGCTSLASVTIPSSVTSIGNSAFRGCSDLTSIIIPDSVISVGQYAFYNCENLSNLTISENIKSFGTSAFEGCVGLTGVYIKDIAKWCNISFSGFYSNPLYYAHNLYFNNTLVTNLIIPSNVTIINSLTFYNCNSLTSVTIPNCVNAVGHWAFYNCYNITSVTIENGVNSINTEAFNYCSGLTSVTISTSVTSIADAAFNNCNSLDYVKYLGTLDQWNSIKIRSNNTPLLNATICYKTTLSATADIGNISIEPSGELFTHDEIKLKADNLLNYSFIGWFDGDNKVSESLIYTFEITGDTVLTAKFEAVTAPVTVTVNCENGAEYTVTNNTSGGNDIFVGDSITIAAKDASKVLQWQNASGKVLGRGGSLTITVGGDTEITLIYKAEGAGQAYVQFVSGSGQVFSAGLYGSEDPISFPVVPTKLGYSFDGWVIDGTDTEATEDNIKSLFSSNKSLTVKPSYTELTTEFTVTVKYSGVNREDVVSSERIGSGFSVEAPEISGFVFQNWTDETGKILSYKNNYYVQVSKDITLIAVYGNEAPVALPVITISGISKVDENGTHKMTASATRSIPDGYELVEHGVLYARDVDGLDETTFVYGTPGVSKYISNKTMQNGVVKLNVKVDNDDVVVSMRGYMILKKNGVLSIYYTDIVSGKYGA